MSLNPLRSSESPSPHDEDQPNTTATASASASSSEVVIVAAVEGGGTHFKAAVAELERIGGERGEDDTDGSRSLLPSEYRLRRVVSHEKFRSDGDPAACLEACGHFFKEVARRNGYCQQQGYSALGIAMFGPVGLDPATQEYGRILEGSPKVAWRGVNFLTPLSKACRECSGSSGDGKNLQLQVRIDTDVNAPALREFRLFNKEKELHNKKRISSCAYITVGTGVGVGLVINGRTVHGRMHPEAGHVLVAAFSSPEIDGGDSDPPFKGYSWGAQCPFGGIGTAEGLASSVALTERYEQIEGLEKGSLSCTADGRSVLETLEDDHSVWEQAVRAVGSLCATLLLVASVERIVIGGGIFSRRPILVDRVRSSLREVLRGYLPLPSDLAELVAVSDQGDDAGLHGAICLAAEALREKGSHGENAAAAAGEGAQEKDRHCDQRSIVMMKREAFGHGFWHGMLVGGVGTALVLRYAVLPLLFASWEDRQPSSRRRVGGGGRWG
jgi:fructokinase